MLSDRERKQLADIEQALAADDRRLAATLGPGAAGGRRWPVRALLGFGVFLLVVALLTGADGLYLQGLLCLGGGFAWLRWRATRSRAGNPSADADPARRAKPDGTPPGGFRPV
jgi:hypothetical protein